MNQNLRISCVPSVEWPRSDREVLDDAFQASSDLLDVAGSLGHLSEPQKTAVYNAYGRWLGFLANVSADGDISSGLDHMSRDNLSAFIARLESYLAPYSVANYVMQLATAVRAMNPEHEMEYLSNAARYLSRTAKPKHDKRKRLKPTQELYELGFDRMQLAQVVMDPISAAAVFRDGLMIAFLAARPVRLANLASIEINRHLERQGEEYWLIFPAKEVKTRRHLEFPLPRDLIEPLQVYLSRHRPILMTRNGRWNTGPHDGLWVSAHGSKLSAGRIEKLIGMRTHERFGHSINPHLFRDAAATSIAIEDPDHVGIVAAILGHSTFRTSERYYNQATSLEAARRFQAAIKSFRDAPGDRP